MRIRVAHSPDSDDAFMFYALASGQIETGDLEYVHELQDIETLNRRALKGELEVTAVSIHAYAYLADRYAAARIRAELDDPAHVWRLARWNDQLIGFAHASVDAAACKLDKLYVDPAHQRRGVGRALLDEISRFARAHAATRLWLQVNRGNAQAIAAYRRYGFGIREARVFAIGDGFVMDDYVMDMPL